MESEKTLYGILRHVHDISIMLYFTCLAVLIGVVYAIVKMEGLSLWFVPVIVIAVYALMRYLINMAD